MYLSYSGFKIARGCLYRWWHMYENHTPHQKEDDRLGSIYGTSVGKLFEQFYQEKLWSNTKECRQILEDRAEGVVDQTIYEETHDRGDWKPAGTIRWKDDETHPRGIYYNREELISDVKHAIPRGLESIRQHALIGRDAVAELYLNTEIGGHKFGGRADFVLTRYRHGDLVIIDGKGTRHALGDKPDKWLDPTQLTWYALLMREKFGKFPDWVAFLLWKIEAPQSVIKYEVTHEEADKLRDEVLALMAKTEKSQALLKKAAAKEDDGVPRLSVVQEYFEPLPNEDNCRFCPYASDGVCTGGAAVVEAIEARYQGKK
jgi:hypothetical protein